MPDRLLDVQIPRFKLANTPLQFLLNFDFQLRKIPVNNRNDILFLLQRPLFRLLFILSHDSNYVFDG
jgi:hypothetical protein